MRFLTAEQKRWLVRKKIKVNGFYSFPPMGFDVYAGPSYEQGGRMDTNPFTKSLAGQFFLVKEITNGFCKGNFYDRPKGPDFYMSEDELSRRTLVEILFLFLITSIPLTIYNWCKGGVEKLEANEHKNSTQTREQS